jgi:metal-responsive CopG/Arc/MetJ family transcriptional regulator
MVMATISVDIPARMHRELELLTLVEDKSLAEVIRELLQAGLEQKRQTMDRAEQERLWAAAYKEIAEEHARLAEESVHYVIEILDPDEDWSDIALTRSINVPAPLYEGLQFLASMESRSIDEVVQELLQAGLEQKHKTMGLTEQERALCQYYREETFSKEHQEMVEDFLRATAEVVPNYDYDWGEVLDE